jgi:hypothetical protein
MRVELRKRDGVRTAVKLERKSRNFRASERILFASCGFYEKRRIVERLHGEDGLQKNQKG